MGPKRYPKQLEPQGEQKRANEPSKTPLRNRVSNNIEKGCEKTQTRSLKEIDKATSMAFGVPKVSKCYAYQAKTYSFLKPPFRKQIDIKSDPVTPL